MSKSSHYHYCYRRHQIYCADRACDKPKYYSEACLECVREDQWRLSRIRERAMEEDA